MTRAIRVLVVAGVAGLLGVRGDTAFAQESPNPDGGCGSHSGCVTPSGSHMIPNLGPGTGNIDAPHSECLVCTSGSGLWSDCHGSCSTLLASIGLRLSPEANAAYKQALAAAKKGDITKVIALGKRADGFVTFNAERSSVQIVSCDGTTIIANLSVRTPKQLATARSLADVRHSLADLAQLRTRAIAEANSLNFE